MKNGQNIFKLKNREKVLEKQDTKHIIKLH